MKKKRNAPNMNFADENVGFSNPIPTPDAPGIVLPIPNATRVVDNGFGKTELPAYMCRDQYGRVYQVPVHYGALPVSGPVPIPVPSQASQVQPIVIPVDDNKRM
ncbi:MAG TPA: hypothetical protein PKY53_02605 [Clostridia bacterium]|jgi:hypothetical protein|nr:hypothetical protein [Clostridia bacterium]